MEIVACLGVLKHHFCVKCYKSDPIDWEFGNRTNLKMENLARRALNMLPVELELVCGISREIIKEEIIVLFKTSVTIDK